MKLSNYSNTFNTMAENGEKSANLCIALPITFETSTSTWANKTFYSETNNIGPFLNLLHSWNTYNNRVAIKY
jgi:hypothetical protein